MEQFVTCSQDKQVHLWDTNSHQPLWSKTIEVKTCVKIPGQEEPSSPLNWTKPELFCAAGSGEVCRFSSQWSGCGSRDHDWKVGHTSVYDAVVEFTCISSLNVCLSRLVGFFQFRTEETSLRLHVYFFTYICHILHHLEPPRDLRALTCLLQVVGAGHRHSGSGFYAHGRQWDNFQCQVLSR